MSKPPKLPQLLKTKIYKTGQTRGADNDVIYQNRVSRSSTVLIPYDLWESVSPLPVGETNFENDLIALIQPKTYFKNASIERELSDKGLALGKNALVFYQLREDWDNFAPRDKGWSPANSRKNPLGGEYVARIAATTAEGGERINEGYTSTGCKGAGIRLFEYAPPEEIKMCRVQLEALFWMCYNSIEAVSGIGMSESDANKCKDYCLAEAKKKDLLDFDKLSRERMINSEQVTICPLCLEPLNALGFLSRLAQAEGREVHDLTVTEINLFHIKELRYGEYNHKTYNLGWGHHHCNVVVKDSGITGTLDWMHGIIERNISTGLYEPSSNGSSA